jgi:hypothetical protein
LRDLAKGASRELGLSSLLIQEVADEFFIKRRAHGKPRRGRWYCNLVVEVERPAATSLQKIAEFLSGPPGASFGTH